MLMRESGNQVAAASPAVVAVLSMLMMCAAGCIFADGGDGEDHVSSTSQEAKPVKSGDGEACSKNADCVSGNCEDGVCCDTACGNDCDQCDVAGFEGVCTPSALGALGSPASCAPYACDGSQTTCPTSCTSDAECSGGNLCVSNTCSSSAPNGNACSVPGDCASGNCIDSVCCDTSCDSECDRCDVAGSLGSCSLAPAGSAGAPAGCDTYLCDGISTACPIDCATSADCVSTAYCDGAGACVPRLIDGTACVVSEECSSDSCVDGVCCDSACAGNCESCDQLNLEGTCTVLLAGALGDPVCGPYVCDGAGGACPSTCTDDGDCVVGVACVGGICSAPKPDGASCGAGPECQSGLCIDNYCCGSACAGACEWCGDPAQLGTCVLRAAYTDGDATCDPYLCTGTASACPSSCVWDVDCAAGRFCSPGGVCEVQQDDGQTCTSNVECLSGACADGYCCDAECAGSCDSCGLAGLEGTCAATVFGSPGAPSCGAYRCDGGSTSCPSSCTVDDHCAAGNFCSAGACAPTLADGASCSDSAHCATGLCVDGTCCDTACAGACDACDLTGSVGTCTPRPDGDPAGLACSPYVCDGISGACPSSCSADPDCAATSTCDLQSASCGAVSGLADGSACAASGDCVSGFCTDGVCCDTACGRACDACNLSGSVGSCTNLAVGAQGAPSCAPYQCGATGDCLFACTTDSDCDGDPCLDGVCGKPYSLVKGWGTQQLLDAANPAAKSPFVIDTAGFAYLHARATGRDVAFEIEDPFGQLITRETAGTSGLVWSEWNSDDPALSASVAALDPSKAVGHHLILRMPSPVAGRWYIKSTATELPLTSDVAVSIMVNTDGASAMAVLTNKATYAPGETISVWVDLRSTATFPPAAITGATVKAGLLEVTMSDGAKDSAIPSDAEFVELTLLDGDNDGVYVGTATISRISTFIVQAQATGVDAFGNTFLRMANASIRIE